MHRTHLSRFGRAATALATVAVTVGLLTACDPPPDTYVALGDSYVAGPLIPSQTLEPLGCLRSSRNYPHVASSAIPTTRFVDVSCSGAELPDLYAPQDVTPGPANPPQLDALDHRTKVVTLGVGGNDIGFSDIVQTCATKLPWSKGCAADYTAGGHDRLSEAIAAVAPGLGQAVRDVRARAPRAAVFVVGYPTVLPATGSGCYPRVPVLPQDVPYLRAKVAELNAMIATQAAANGATYVDLATPSIGHDFSASDNWVEGIVPTSTAAPVHPNAAGMAAAATTVAAAINARFPS